MLAIEDPPQARTTVGQRIKARRRELGLTQSALAARLGLSQPTLSAYEKGITQIPRYHLERIADKLGVEQRYLDPDLATDDLAALPDFLLSVEGKGLTIRVDIKVDRDITGERMAQILKHLRRLLNEGHSASPTD